MICPEQAVRDLRWVISSPSLIRDLHSDRATVADLPAFETNAETEIDAGTLVSFLAERSDRRVGRYFENLVHFWLETVRGYTVVAAGLPVRDGRQTIGELDFVYRDHSGELIHLEIAVKFYLYHPFETAFGSHLIGPNSADTFERKMSKLFDQQLPLSHTVFPEIRHRQALVKGRIFFHPRWPRVEGLCSRLSPSHLTGEWVSQTELFLLNTGTGTGQYRVLEKPFWLTAPRLGHDAWLTYEELKNRVDSEFRHYRRPLMVSVRTEESESDSEDGRVFIVSREWPRQGAK